MTGSRLEKTVRMEHGHGPPPDANVVDLAMAQTIMDASQHEGGRLVRLDKNAFELDGPVEPVAMKESVIVRIAYRLPE